MATSLSPQTIFLARSVAAGYTCLGLFGMCAPMMSAKFFGLYTRQQNMSPKTASDVQAADDSDSMFKASSENPPNPEQSTAISMQLLGCRDLSIGTALWWLDSEGKYREMAILILSGMILCATDVAWVWRLKGMTAGLFLGTGAAIWAWIGYNLLNS